MSDPAIRYAPGWPGIPPRWTSSAKTGIGTALNHHSRVWFTISHGILNEIYFPRVDQACTRDMGFIITDGKNFFATDVLRSALQSQNNGASYAPDPEEQDPSPATAASARRKEPRRP